MEIFTFLIVGGIAIAVAKAAMSWKATNEAWPTAARQLGFAYVSGGLLGQREMSGTLSACAVRVATRSSGGDGPSSKTEYELAYREALPFDVRLTAQHAVAAGTRASVGAPDLEIGVPMFDDRVLIKGDDLPAIRRMLGPALQTSILRAMDTFPGLVIDEKGVRWSAGGVAGDVAEMVRTTRRLADLASNVAASATPRKGTPSRSRTEKPSQQRDAPPEPWEPPRREAASSRTPPRRIRTDRLSRSASEHGPASPLDAAPPRMPSVPATSGGPHVAEVCTTLFGGAIASYAVEGAFERDFRGRPVRWSGRLRSVARYPFDHVFGTEPGARAVLDIHELPSGYGERTIQAIVRVEAEEEPRLRRLAGQQLEFTGILWRCDGFRRQIFVANGWVGTGA